MKRREEAEVIRTQFNCLLCNSEGPNRTINSAKSYGSMEQHFLSAITSVEEILCEYLQLTPETTTLWRVYSCDQHSTSKAALVPLI